MFGYGTEFGGGGDQILRLWGLVRTPLLGAAKNEPTAKM